jgi:uncharacterized protein (DUF1778 family)
MPRDSASPVSFRLSAEDRRLVEIVSAFYELSLSDFIRQVVVEAARDVLEREGPDKVLEVVRESNSRLAEQRLQLFRETVNTARRERAPDRASSGC